MIIEIKRNMNLKKLIKQAGVKQYEVAATLGIDESLLSKYIWGARKMPEDAINKLAELLEVNKSEIIL